MGQVRDSRYLSEATCGPQVLGTIDGISYSGVGGEKGDCGFYQKHLEEMGVQNSDSKGVFFITAFTRKFTEFAV